MHTIGLVGGMSWHSTVTYYRLINERVAAVLGGHSSARIVLDSLDFAEVRRMQEEDRWEDAARLLSGAALTCQAAGAEAVAICTNLMHKVAPEVERALDVPLLHIADAVAGVAAEHGWTTLGLLGTRWTMEETFYADRLARHGIGVVVPDADDRALVDRVIWDELTVGRLEPSSRAEFVRVIDRLAAAGAQAVVLGCTEIELLVGPEDTSVPLLDSAAAHAAALADFVLGRAGLGHWEGALRPASR